MAGKVLFTASTYSHIRRFHLPYMRRLKERGWTIHVACGGKPEKISYAKQVMALPLQKSMTAPANLQATAMLRKTIRAEGYDLISANTSLAAYFTRLAVKGMEHRPYVVNTVHGYLFDDDTPIFRRHVLLQAEKVTARETDLLLAMNDWDYNVACRYSLGRTIRKIAGMGVNFDALDRAGPQEGSRLRKKLGIPKKAVVLVYPAEFSHRKSQEVLLRGLTALPENILLALPGSGVLLDDCKALATSLGLGRRVLFPGEIRNIAPWYAMADVAVTASRGEGLPVNVLEALHCGLPVVASAVKGHTDLIQPGVNGFLYLYGDSQAMTDAVRRLLSLSPKERRAMSRAAVTSAEPYKLSNVLPASPLWELADRIEASHRA